MTRHTPPVQAYRRARRNRVMREIGVSIGTRIIRNLLWGVMVLGLPMATQQAMLHLGLTDWIILP